MSIAGLAALSHLCAGHGESSLTDLQLRQKSSLEKRLSDPSRPTNERPSTSSSSSGCGLAEVWPTASSGTNWFSMKQIYGLWLVHKNMVSNWFSMAILRTVHKNPKHPPSLGTASSFLRLALLLLPLQHPQHPTPTISMKWIYWFFFRASMASQQLERCIQVLWNSWII